MRTRSQIGLAVALGIVVALPARAQTNDEFWSNTWFWGAQAGTFLYTANGTQAGGLFGGHWFITAKKSAFSLSFDQLVLPTSTVQVGTDQVTFSSGQRLQAMVFARPSTGPLQIYLGGGFGIHHITDAVSTTLAESRVEELSTKAFAILGGGVQWRILDRWVAYGQYQYMPGTGDFLITSDQHSIQGGLRYALTRAKEAVSTER